jgi:hypothetical protein
MTKLTYNEIKTGDIFTTTNEYGGKCDYKIIKEKDGKIELVNLTLFNEPLFVTEEWFKNKEIATRN